MTCNLRMAQCKQSVFFLLSIPLLAFPFAIGYTAHTRMHRERERKPEQKMRYNVFARGECRQLTLFDMFFSALLTQSANKNLAV